MIFQNRIDGDAIANTRGPSNGWKTANIDEVADHDIYGEWRRGWRLCRDC